MSVLVAAALVQSAVVTMSHVVEVPSQTRPAAEPVTCSSTRCGVLTVSYAMAKDWREGDGLPVMVKLPALPPSVPVTCIRV